MSTPHISAKKGEIAKTVFIAGDPLRIEKMAKSFLDDAKLVSSIRGIYAYTGILKNSNSKVTFMAHGMGLGSVGIYVEELFGHYDVDNVIRLGSAGAYTKELKLYDIVVGEYAYSEADFGSIYGIKDNNIAGSKELTDKYIEASKNESDLKIIRGKINSSNWFYRSNSNDSMDFAKKHKLDAVEMEAFALYVIAKKYKKNALTIVTISDHLVTGEVTSPLERQNKFIKMFDYACKAFL